MFSSLIKNKGDRKEEGSGWSKIPDLKHWHTVEQLKNNTFSGLPFFKLMCSNLYNVPLHVIVHKYIIIQLYTK